MPGIAGFISSANAQVRRGCLDEMLGAMVREPFHNSGALNQEELGLAIGWVCHKGSFSDCLPVWNEKKRSGGGEGECVFCGLMHGPVKNSDTFRLSAIF